MWARHFCCADAQILDAALTTTHFFKPSRMVSHNAPPVCGETEIHHSFRNAGLKFVVLPAAIAIFIVGLAHFYNKSASRQTVPVHLFLTAARLQQQRGGGFFISSSSPKSALSCSTSQIGFRADDRFILTITKPSIKSSTRSSLFRFFICENRIFLNRDWTGRNRLNHVLQAFLLYVGDSISFSDASTDRPAHLAIYMRTDLWCGQIKSTVSMPLQLFGLRLHPLLPGWHQT